MPHDLMEERAARTEPKERVRAAEGAVDTSSTLARARGRSGLREYGPRPRADGRPQQEVSDFFGLTGRVRRSVPGSYPGQGEEVEAGGGGGFGTTLRAGGRAIATAEPGGSADAGRERSARTRARRRARRSA